MKNPHAVALGLLGGAKGGAARAKALGPQRRIQIARRAALARANALDAGRRREIAQKAAVARWSRLPALLMPLFWEQAPEELRLPQNEDLVFLHVLAHGNPGQVEWLRRRFGDRKIRAWLRKRRGWGIPGKSTERVEGWIAPEELARWRAEDPNYRLSGSHGLLSGQDAPMAVRRLLKTYEPAALLWAEPDHRYAIVREVLVRGDEEARGWLQGVMAREAVVDLVRQYHGAGSNEPERQKLRAELGLGTDDIPVRPYLGLE